MNTDSVLDALRQAEEQLQAELEAIPQFKMLTDVRALIQTRLNASLGEVMTQKAPSVSVPRGRTVAAIVTDAAEAYLRSIGRRAQTPAIAEALTRQGITAGSGANMAATVSSYLSSARKRFDNVKGQGYGLIEWTAHSGAPASEHLGIPATNANAPIMERTPIKYEEEAKDDSASSYPAVHSGFGDDPQSPSVHSQEEVAKG